jgi:hypothetical protein
MAVNDFLVLDRKCTRPFVVLPAVANINHGLSEELFPIRKPHTRSRLVLRNRKSTHAGANVGAPFTPPALDGGKSSITGIEAPGAIS